MTSPPVSGEQQTSCCWYIPKWQSVSQKFPTNRTWGGEENQPHFVSLPLIDFCRLAFACADTGEKYLGITSVFFRNAARLKLKKSPSWHNANGACSHFHVTWVCIALADSPFQGDDFRVPNSRGPPHQPGCEAHIMKMPLASSRINLGVRTPHPECLKTTRRGFLESRQVSDRKLEMWHFFFENSSFTDRRTLPFQKAKIRWVHLPSGLPVPLLWKV